MITIEPFDYTDVAYLTAIQINAAVHAAPLDRLEEWKHDDETRNTAYPFYRDWVLRDGEIVGYVETFQNQYAYHPEKYEFRVFVDPEQDDADIRPIVLTHTLERLADQPLIALSSGMLDDKLEAMRFFAAHGFVKVAEEKLSKLVVADFVPVRHQSTVAKVKQAGVEIFSLRALQGRDRDWQTMLYDLYITVNPDIPSTGEKHYEGFETWRSQRLAGPHYDPDAWVVAVHAGQYIAQSTGTINREGGLVLFYTGMTTVRREWRRMGVATALKLHVIAYAKAQGVAEIHTSNAATNPMYQLNMALGFAPLPSWVRVEKRLNQPRPSQNIEG